jgi:hypothetical protein
VIAEPAPDARPVSLRSALRAIRPLLATAGVDDDGAQLASAAPLERLVMRAELPQVAACVPIESGASRVIAPGHRSRVAGFLDGVQRSRLVGHLEGAPLVYATVAAAVRERTDRRLSTWREPLVRRLLLASRARVGDRTWSALEESGLPLVDMTADVASDTLPVHPHALRARALDLVALERERLERALAAAWCGHESRWLWIDGGIAGNLAVDASATAFGVVKSHATLYGDDAIRRVLALPAGSRSPSFLVGHRARRAVASWYLRLREPGAGDPLFGLVRVEVVPPPALSDPATATSADITDFAMHCDAISADILLERSPLSLPDARWDTLAYGIHACEMYLQALVGP